jgi:hypothetical protein
MKQALTLQLSLLTLLLNVHVQAQLQPFTPRHSPAQPRKVSIHGLPATIASNTAEQQPQKLKPKKTNHSTGIQKSMTLWEEVIGQTTYDNQSNSSMQHRIIVDDDNQVHAIWAHSDAANSTTWPDRGTGYNSGSYTLWDTPPTDRIENVRTGFPEIIRTGDGGEAIFCHQGVDSLTMLKRAVIGEGDWIVSRLPDNLDNDFVWATAASDGNFIHVIALSAPSGLNGTPLNDIDGNLVYWRSSNNGQTWDIQSQLFDNITADQFEFISSQTYAIDARNGKVCIALFSQFADAIVLTSENNGLNWYSTVFWDFPIDGYTYDTLSDVDGDGIADILDATDGCGAIHIGANGTVHLAFGYGSFIDDTPGDTFYNAYLTEDLLYWNSTLPTDSLLTIGSIEQSPDPNLFIDTPQSPDYSTSLASMPTMGEDADGNIYIVFSAADEEYLGDQVFRHLYARVLDEAGNIISDQVELTPDVEFNEYEYVFPSMWKEVSDVLHIVVQRDYEPGLNVRGDLDAWDTNEIVYLSITNDLDIFNSTFTPGCMVETACNFNPFANSNDNSCLFIGNPCDDGLNNTIDDVIQADCVCAGIPGCAGYAVNPVIVQPSCAGQNNGSIFLSTAGISGPYSYLWSNGATSSNLNSLAPGNYTVVVNDASACEVSLNFSLVEPAPLIVTAPVSNVTCVGQSNGSASAQVSGGTLPYSYTWSTFPIQNTANATNLSAGQYQLLVSDANGCTSLTGVEITEPDNGITVSGAIVSANCNQSNGAIQTTVEGAQGSVFYTWSNGQTGPNLSNVPAGLYTLTVESNGCITSQSFSVNNTDGPNLLALTQNISCFNGQNGIITLTTTGGTPPYSYIWSNGGAGNSQSNLSAGVYDITVSDNNGCIDSYQAVITQPTPLSNFFTVASNGCGTTPSGTIASNVIGGLPPYSYSWSNGNSGAALNNLEAGNYTLTVTDAGGCTASFAAEVENNSGLEGVVAAISPSCSGFSDGAAQIEILGGSPPFTYSWSTGENSAYIENLAPGNYSCEVTDAAGCALTLDAVIENPYDIDYQILGLTEVPDFSIQTYSTTFNPNAAYLWTVTGGNVISSPTENFVEIQWGDNTSGEVILTVFFPDGCQYNFAQNVEIGGSKLISEVGSSLMIYPNPFSQFIQFETAMLPVEYEILDSSGKLTAAGVLFKSPTTIDTSELSPGFYVIHAKSSDESLPPIQLVKFR